MARPFLPILLACAGLAPLAAADGLVYQFNLRAGRTDAYLHDQGADRYGGGGGMAIILGQDLLRLRVRMDGDNFPVRSGGGQVQVFGAGAEALLLLPVGDRVRPYLSVGPAFQQWQLSNAEKMNKAALRAEAGIWFQGKVAASAGLLAGATRPGRTDTLTYVQVSFMF